MEYNAVGEIFPVHAHQGSHHRLFSCYHWQLRSLQAYEAPMINKYASLWYHCSPQCTCIVDCIPKMPGEGQRILQIHPDQK